MMNRVGLSGIALVAVIAWVSLSATETDARGNNGNVTTIVAQDVWALAIALRVRDADHSLSRSERDLRNFDVRITDLGSELEVRFVAHRAPEEDPSLGGSTSLGRDMAYGLRKVDGKLLYSHGFK